MLRIQVSAQHCQSTISDISDSFASIQHEQPDLVGASNLNLFNSTTFADVEPVAVCGNVQYSTMFAKHCFSF